MKLTAPLIRTGAFACAGTRVRPVTLPGDARLPDGTGALCRFTRA